jgi:hypothetical protein
MHRMDPQVHRRRMQQRQLSPYNCVKMLYSQK